MANVIFFSGSMSELRELIPTFFGSNKPAVNSINELRLATFPNTTPSTSMKSSNSHNTTKSADEGFIVDANGVITSEKFSAAKHLRNMKVGDYIDVKTSQASFSSAGLRVGSRTTTKSIGNGVKRLTVTAKV